MKTTAEIRERAKLKLELRAAKAAARRNERAARAEDARHRRATRATFRRQYHSQQAERRRATLRAAAASAARWRTVAPIALVTGFAVYGQFAYGVEEYRQPILAVTVLIAVGAAAAVESISLYVQWHAHDALLHNANGTAGRLRRASYLLAFGVAAVNYSHFSEGWRPTPAAVVFALFSASSPWLWGLHTRRAQRMQLLREGKIDSTGAVFCAERFRAFPIRTIKARRYSIDHGITDPQVAWEAYRLEIARRRDNLPAAWQQLAVALLHLDVARERAESAANMVSPIDVPALERVEDVVVPDLDQMDDNGLSLHWKTAPPAGPVTTAKPKRPATSATAETVDLTEVRKLAAEGAGRRTVAKELGISEHIARKLLDELPLNGHKVNAS